MSNELAARCQQAREKAGLSIWQVTSLLGPEAARVETGGEYDELRLRALADTYGVSIAWLRDGIAAPLDSETAEALRAADIDTADRDAVVDLLKMMSGSSRVSPSNAAAPPSPKRTAKEITAEMYGLVPFSGRGSKHGAEGPCEPDCRKCALEAELGTVPDGCPNTPRQLAGPLHEPPTDLRSSLHFLLNHLEIASTPVPSHDQVVRDRFSALDAADRLRDALSALDAADRLRDALSALLGLDPGIDDETLLAAVGRLRDRSVELEEAIPRLNRCWKQTVDEYAAKIADLEVKIIDLEAINHWW